MAKYTTTFYDIAMMLKGGAVNYDEGVQLAASYIFTAPLPFYSNNQTEIENFKKKFIQHYFKEELGQETPDLFRGRLYTRLLEIMPKYQQLYQTMTYGLADLMNTVDVWVTTDHDSETNSENTDTLEHGHKIDTSENSSKSGTTENDLTNLRTDALETKRTDNLKTAQTDDFTNTRTDNLVNKLSNDLSATRTDNLKAQRTDNLSEGTTSESNSQQLVSDEPNTTIANNAYASRLDRQEITGSGSRTNTGTQTTENTGTEKTVNTGTQTTNNTGTQTTDNTGTRNIDNTGTQTTDNTGTQTITNTGTVSSNEESEHTTGVINSGTDTHNVNMKENNQAHDKHHRAGYEGDRNKMIAEYRNNILNLDLQIIAECQNLFMMIF